MMWIFPVDGNVWFTDTYGAQRGGGTRQHLGQDIFAAKGTVVRAVDSGQVVSSTKGKSPTEIGGHWVKIQHLDGVQTYYAHLDQSPLVGSGEKVFRGQEIGRVGNTGNAKNLRPHLHISASKGGAHFNIFSRLTDAKEGFMTEQEKQMLLSFAEGFRRGGNTLRAYATNDVQKQAAQKLIDQSKRLEELAKEPSPSFFERVSRFFRDENAVLSSLLPVLWSGFAFRTQEERRDTTENILRVIDGANRAIDAVTRATQTVVTVGKTIAWVTLGVGAVWLIFKIKRGYSS